MPEVRIRSKENVGSESSKLSLETICISIASTAFMDRFCKPPIPAGHVRDRRTLGGSPLRPPVFICINDIRLYRW